MSKVVFYFSGTGNSLYVARLLSDELGFSCQSITEYLNGEVYEVDLTQIVLVFPMYNHSYPLIVREFISKLSMQGLLKNTHISAVCTYGNDLGITLIQLEILLKYFGASLSLGYGIQMPYNYVEPSGFKLRGLYDSFIVKEYTDMEVDSANKAAEKKINSIKSQIANKANAELEATSVFIETIVDKLGMQDTIQKKVWAKVAGTNVVKDESFYDMVKHMDDGFTVTEKCVGCGICSSICPVGNISQGTDENPKFNNNCEQCFACISWCPSEAIEFRRSTVGRSRYHNPKVTIADMIEK